MSNIKLEPVYDAYDARSTITVFNVLDFGMKYIQNSQNSNIVAKCLHSSDCFINFN